MSLPKILLLMVTINGLLYLGGATLFDNDIFSMITSVDEDTDNVVDYGGFGDQLPSESSASAGNFGSDSAGFSFFDALGMVVGVLLFLLNLVLAPVAIFVGTGMPLVLQIGVGVPVGILYALGIIVLIRGGGA